MGTENGRDKLDAIEIAELLLTADIYNRKENLTEDDLPPNIRKHYFDAESRGVKRPIYVTSSDVEKIFGILNVKSVIKDLTFVAFEEFGSQLRLNRPLNLVKLQWLQALGLKPTIFTQEPRAG